MRGHDRLIAAGWGVAVTIGVTSMVVYYNIGGWPLAVAFMCGYGGGLGMAYFIRAIFTPEPPETPMYTGYVPRIGGTLGYQPRPPTTAGRQPLGPPPQGGSGVTPPPREPYVQIRTPKEE